MQTVLEVLKKTEAFFAKGGLENPKIEAEWLLAESLGCKRLELFLQWERPLAEDDLSRLREQVRRRASGEPLQYVLGYSDFHDIRLGVSPGVLIPRPETEELVAGVLEEMRGHEAPRLIDLGTGSGAIALALAKALPSARVLALDTSGEALRQARANAESLGLRDRVAFRRGDWLTGLDTEADCIVANPPYLTGDEWEAARPEVRQHEPREALVSGDEGMADLKRILFEAHGRLAPGGLLAMETGIAHGEPLREAAVRNGYSRVEVRKDLHRRDRFLYAWK